MTPLYAGGTASRTSRTETAAIIHSRQGVEDAAPYANYSQGLATKCGVEVGFNGSGHIIGGHDLHHIVAAGLDPAGFSFHADPLSGIHIAFHLSSERSHIGALGQLDQNHLMGMEPIMGAEATA